jgi:hypothetical protein
MRNSPFFSFAIFAIFIASSTHTAVRAIAVPSQTLWYNIIHSENRHRQELSGCLSTTPDNWFPMSLRGGDMVLRSKRRYGTVRGIHVACASVVVLALPSVSFQIIRVAAATILISSILQYTIQKGFL